MGHISFPAPPPFLAGTGQTAPGPDVGSETGTSWNSDIWVGYAATASSNAYKYVVGAYNEPQALSTPCVGNKEVTWDGLGGVPGGAPLAQIGTGIHSRTRADFITERPTNPDKSIAPLTDFSYITWLDAEAEQSSGLNPLGSWPNDNFTMYNYNGGYDLAHPGPLYNGGKQFSVFYDTCN